MDDTNTNTNTDAVAAFGAPSAEPAAKQEQSTTDTASTAEPASTTPTADIAVHSVAATAGAIPSDVHPAVSLLSRLEATLMIMEHKLQAEAMNLLKEIKALF